MALDFAAMTRVFATQSKPDILQKLDECLSRLDGVRRREDYDQLHAEFCAWFTQNIKGNKKRKGRLSSYGQAAKVFDIAAKVYVYYCAMPSSDAASVLVPLLHGDLDNPMIERLIRRFTCAGLTSKSLEDVDQQKYEQLQSLCTTRDTRRLPFGNPPGAIRRHFLPPLES